MAAAAPAKGKANNEREATPIETDNLLATPQALENELLRVQFAADGSISSVYDKVHSREVIPADSFANTLDVYDDDGNAWDFAFDYRMQTPERFKLVSSEASIDGPHAIVTQHYQYGDSALTQQIILTLGHRMLKFATETDWRENGKMLRTRFPLAIHAWEATCDIQFGSIKRPTHQNTTWDMAKYEIAAHKWVDLSQRDYGVALMNDCKYGYHIEEGVIDLNLLRSPHSPDPVADRAQHQFTYALFPHQGDHVEGKVAHAAYMLNIPLEAAVTSVHSGSLPASASLVQVDAPNVIVEAVKKSEDGSGVVVRLYENTGASVATHVTVNGAASAELTNLVETVVAPLTVSENGIAVDFHPFEIQTVKVK
jgi:alpha-mannosidase